MANKNKRSPFSKALTFIKLNHISGPRGYHYFEYVRHFQKNILGAFTQVYKEYGAIASFPWPMNSVIIYSPSYAKKVLVESSKNYIKGEQIEELRAVVGNGLATNNDYSSWLKSRSLISKVFTKKSVENFCPIFNEKSIKQIDEWNLLLKAKNEIELDICEQMKLLTFDIACTTLLGAQLSREEAFEINEAVHYTSIVTYQRIFQFFPLPYWIPTFSHIKFHRHFKVMNSIVMKLINNEKNSLEDEGQKSILQKLVHAYDPETNHRFSDSELRDEALTLMLAGHETSAHTLTWIIGLLAKNQDVQTKLQDEIDDNKNLSPLMYMEKMNYLVAIIKESMRLYPAFPVLSRKACVNDSIGDHFIPKDTNVVIPIFVIQRSEEFWSDPLTFNPERFYDGKNENTYNTLPFSRGPRRCVAEYFAMVEMCIVIFNIFKNYNVSLVGKDMPLAIASVSLKPEGGMPVKMTKRR